MCCSKEVARLFTALASPFPCLLALFLGPALFTAQATNEPHDLLPRHPVSVLLTPGATIGVRIDVGKAEAEEILLQTAAPGVAFRLVSSDGMEIQSGRAATAGWLAISLAASDQKQLLLRLSLDGIPTDQTSVRVRIDWIQIGLSTLSAHARAARLHSVAQALRYSLHAADVSSAIAEYRQAADEWRRSGDSYGEAIALGSEAESLFELSRFSEAAGTLDRAVNLDLKNDYLHAWLAHLKARAFLEEWESEKAQRDAEESLSLGNKLHEPAILAEARADLAEAGYWTNWESTAKFAQDALTAARLSGLPETAAHCLRTQAWMEEDLSHLPQAVSLMTEAEEYFRRAGNPRLALQSMEDLAGIESRAGDNFGALTQYARLAPLSHGTGNVVDYGIQLENIGTEYLLLNRLATARVYFHMAEEAFSSVTFRSGISLVRGKICDAELRSLERNDGAASGVLQRALKNCESSAAIIGKIQDPLRTAVATYQVGLVYQRMARVDRRRTLLQRARIENQRALDLFETAATTSHSVHDHHWEAQELISKGEVLEDLGKRQDARGEFEQALKLSMGERNLEDKKNLSAPEDPPGVLQARYHIARWYAEDSQLDMAEETLKPALDQIEATRKSVLDSTLQASYFAAERKCYELGMDLQMQKYKRNQAAGNNADALELSEESHARSLLDALSVRPGIDAATKDIHANLMQARMAVDEAFDQRLRLMLEGGTKRELDANAANLTQALGALQRAEIEIYVPANPTDQSTRIITVDKIKSASERSGDTYLEFELGEMHSYLWVVDQGKLTSYPLPPRDQIEDMVKKWRAFVTAVREAPAPPSHESVHQDSGKDFEQLSAELSKALLSQAVTPQMKRLVIVPDGDLAMLPFTALPESTSSPTPGTPLIAGHEIILTPSLSVFLSPKPTEEHKHYKGEVAVVADPVFDADDERFTPTQTGGSSHSPAKPKFDKPNNSLPRLLNTKFEADIIQNAIGSDQVHLWLGFDASLETILSPEMQGYRIWHFATHGLYDETTPEFSGLVFSLVASDRRPEYGFLKAQDVAHMRFHPELVVLSACDSAAGENMSGEGAMGLGYSFLRAGAKRVITTLWSVDDAMSMELMDAFYREMKRNGNNAADALRKSQLAVMHLHYNSSPHYWAGFELISAGN